MATAGKNSFLHLDEVHFNFVTVYVADVLIRPSPCLKSFDILIVGMLSTTICFAFSFNFFHYS